MKFPLTILFLFITSFLFAQQNLVPNPSFEDTVNCPDALTTIDYSQGWYSYANTPDYFNTCSTNSNYSVPSNGWGNQNPFSGNAYAGFWAYYCPYAPNGREFIGRALATPMNISQIYFVSMTVSLSDLANCAINKIGIRFSTVPYNWISNPDSVNNSPQIYTNNIITDTANWTTISGWFTADSAYQFVIIGNYFNDILTDTIILGAPQFYGYGAYYFVDDICVSTDSLTCYHTESINENNIIQDYINVFPNPATNELTIEFTLKDKCYFELIDVIGAKRKVVAFDNGLQTKKIDLIDIDSGIYFYSLVDRNGNRIKTGKLIVVN